MAPGSESIVRSGRLEPRNPSLWLLLALALGAAAPRLIQAGAQSAFMDELLWLREGARTVERLARGPQPPAAWKRDLSHPGVLVALVAGWAQGGRPPHTSTEREHVRVLRRARQVIALASVLTVLALFVLAAPLVGRRTAGLGAAFLAASPFHVAMGPWLECDSSLTLWTTVALLCAARYLHEPQRRARWLLLCALATGQAIVAKISGVLLLPVLGSALVFWPGSRGLRELVRPAAPVFLLVVAVVVYACWPRIWLDPREVLNVLAWGRHVAEKGHPNFFLGTITRDPPWTYYLAVVPIRLGEVELAGLAGAAAIAVSAVVRRRRGLAPDPTLLLLVTFAVVWIVFFSAQPKKLGARYVLPIWPAISLVGGWATARAIETLAGARARALATAAAVLLVAGQLAWTMAPVWPDRLVAYDRLLGGLRLAAGVELVGYGVVEKDIARALDDLPRGARVGVAAHPTSVAWHTRRRFGVLRDPGLERAVARRAWDYLIVARYERVRRPILDRAVSRLPVVEAIRRDGVDLAWVLDARRQ